jgi:O-succinylbenzoate synthase
VKIEKIALHHYQIPLISKSLREGILIEIWDEKERAGWGDIAPLPNWSKENLRDVLGQLDHIKDQLFECDWTAEKYQKEIAQLAIYPSLAFGVESALSSLLDPLPPFSFPASALLMGTKEEILAQAKMRHQEGFTTAKVKVNNLSFSDASSLLSELKDVFRLRVDVNRAWDVKESLHFFSQFAYDAFDYVEEPCRNPKDLVHFSHPVAVDESFPSNFSLEELMLLTTLKALIFKPTMQGGFFVCRQIQEWANRQGIDVVLSSSFESDVGLAHVVAMAQRLGLKAAVGIGTYHHLSTHLCREPLNFSQAQVHVPREICPF